MGSDRQVIADQILKAIDYGNLPQDEIERRLEQIIETELNVPFNAEINKDKVDLCNSLLRRLYSQGGIKDKVDIEESKEKVRKRVNAYRRRRNILWTAVRSIAAALILVVGLTLLNVIPPIRWFTGTSTDDEQQYIVQGHVINTQTIANAIAAHDSAGSLTTQSIEEVKDFLGFDISFPPKIEDQYLAIDYDITILPEFIRVSCSYKDMQRQPMKDVSSVVLTLFTNEESYLQFEQDAEGELIKYNNTMIYKLKNQDRISYLWINQGIMYRFITLASIQITNKTIEGLIDWRYLE